MRSRRHSGRGWPLVGVVFALVACGGPRVLHQPPGQPPFNGAAPPVLSARVPAPPKPKPRPKPKPAPKPFTGNPLTGLYPMPRGRVFAVKIDNTAAGRPQVNINAADVVYVEQVEGGLTRLIAVYASRLPAAVGPVRSVRLGDPLLLAPYGGVALAFSGGASGVVAAVHQTHVVDASYPAHPGPYWRSGARPAPYNLMANLHDLAGVLHRRSAHVRDVGFRWATQVRGLAHAHVVHALQGQVGNTPVGFRWDARTRRWDRQIDGHTVVQSNGAAVSTPNVVIQFCQVVPDRRDVDVAGNPSADTKPVGSGRALIFRNGRVLKGRWVRASPHAQTHFISASGHDIPLQPGGAWVLLAPRGSIVHTT